MIERGHIACPLSPPCPPCWPCPRCPPCWPCPHAVHHVHPDHDLHQVAWRRPPCLRNPHGEPAGNSPGSHPQVKSTFRAGNNLTDSPRLTKTHTLSNTPPTQKRPDLSSGEGLSSGLVFLVAGALAFNKEPSNCLAFTTLVVW